MNGDFQADTHEEGCAVLVFVLIQIAGKTPVRSPEPKAW